MTQHVELVMSLFFAQIGFLAYHNHNSKGLNNQLLSS